MEKKQGFTHDNKNNMTVDWYTPPSIFEMLLVNGWRFKGLIASRDTRRLKMDFTVSSNS